MLDALRRLESLIRSVTGSLDVLMVSVNDSTIELHLIYPGSMALGDILRSLVSLKKLLHRYGLRVINPTIETPEDDILHVVVKVVEGRSSVSSTI